ncbi:hypothetical protein BP6252_01504 [Coleophoma cylindrospora]|uniref:DNA-directed RNA polymerases I and III subunit RPAC2 n=1 Tax=Coleophoma cylindrospora TaxID=1849047 RepID=A0A3D8ST51_9HELO|nr:hypothetical protein BP6252_01504 [Coleophoma cylindrospora]
MAPAKTKKSAKAVASQEEDITMDDAPVATQEHEDEEGEDVAGEDQAPPEDEDTLEQRITVLPGGTEQAASFQLKQEDHTLGNALRYIIMKNPDVEFCGYSIPHPSEALMNIRIQTYDGTAKDALSKGLDDLMDLCDVVAGKFQIARDGYMNSEAGKADQPEA